jgi:glycosyltransferase involved in cell wall biosynthesis
LNRDHFRSSDITVVIPFRSPAPFLAETLQSICSANPVPGAIVLVQDGPLDSTTIDVVERTASLSIPTRVVRSTGRGVADARQTGLSSATTPLIAQMDADDIVHSRRFGLQAAALSAKRLSLIGGQATTIDASGTQHGALTYPTRPFVASRLLSISCVLCSPAVTFRREIAAAVGGYRNLFVHEGAPLQVEDYDLWMRMAKVAPVANLREDAVAYRLHETQYTSVHAPRMQALNLGVRFANLTRGDQSLGSSLLPMEYGALERFLDSDEAERALRSVPWFDRRFLKRDLTRWRAARRDLSSL